MRQRDERWAEGERGGWCYLSITLHLADSQSVWRCHVEEFSWRNCHVWPTRTTDDRSSNLGLGLRTARRS